MTGNAKFINANGGNFGCQKGREVEDEKDNA